MFAKKVLFFEHLKIRFRENDEDFDYDYDYNFFTNYKKFYMQ